MDGGAVGSKAFQYDGNAVRGQPAGRGARMKALRVLHAILREIFEESAYERFCMREGVLRGRESYAAFLRQRRVRVKCC